MLQRGSYSAPQDGALPSARTGDTPQRIGRFLIEELVGRGGMSDVYRAFDPELKRHVALKVLSPTLGRNPDFKDRFIRESRAAATLHHPNIVPIYEAGADGDTLFIAMRLVPGRDLKTFIENEGPLSPLLASEVIRQTSDALDHAHSAGLVHRDVKPANLLLEEDGSSVHVYLTDFGLTKSLGTDSRITNTGELVGSVHYVSPEHLEGRDLDHRSDIYSLGCVLHECLTGRPPFERETDMAVLLAHLNADPPRASKGRKNIPHLVDRVISRAIAKERDERFDSCSELAESFSAALKGVPINLPTPRSRPRKVAPGRLRRATSIAAVLLVLGASGAVAVRYGTEEPKVGVADPGMNERTRNHSDRGERNQPGTRRTEERSKGPDPSQRPGRGGGIAGDLTAEREAEGDPQVEAPEIEVPHASAMVATRTIKDAYDVRSSVGDQCTPDQTARTGCIEFVLGSNESFLDVVISDQSGFDVGAYVRQDIDRNGDWDGAWTPVCNQTTKPAKVTPGSRVQIVIDPQGCGGDSTPTTGLITARLFRNS